MSKTIKRSAGFCAITDGDIMRLDSLSMQHKPLLHIAIAKGAPYSGGPILPELHPDYTYTRHDLPDGTTRLHWEPNDQAHSQEGRERGPASTNE